MKITISIQDDLYMKLKQFVPSRHISQFISESIKKELDSREAVLLNAYTEAYSDLERNEELMDWDVLNIDLSEEQPSPNKRER